MVAEAVVGVLGPCVVASEAGELLHGFGVVVLAEAK